jgi:DNA primase
VDVKYESPYDADWKVVILPQGKDPDEIIREDDSRWQELVDEATPLVDYIFKVVISKLDMSKLSDRSLAVDQLAQVINNIKDPIRRAHYMQKLAHLIGVNEHTIASAVRRARAPKQKKVERKKPSAYLSSLTSENPLEKYCLYMLFSCPKLSHWTHKLSAEYFERGENQQLFITWCNTSDIESMRQELSGTLQDCLDELLRSSFPSLSEAKQEEAMTDCVSRLQERCLRNIKLKEALLISDAQAEGDVSGIDKQQEIESSVKRTSAQLGEIFIHKKGKSPKV